MRVLVGHVLLLMLVVELAAAGRGAALRNQVSSSHKRALVVSSVAVF